MIHIPNCSLRVANSSGTKIPDESGVLKILFLLAIAKHTWSHKACSEKERPEIHANKNSQTGR